MKIVNSENEIKSIIKNNKMAIIYFTGIDCGACGVIKDKVEEILKGYPKIESVEISGEKNVEVAATYDVFSLPLLILYVEGKETIRVGRNVSILELNADIDRYYEMIFEN